MRKLFYYVQYIHEITKPTNTGQVVLQLTVSITADNSENSESGESQSSIEMYSTSIKEIQDVMSVVGRTILLTKDYTTGNETFKQGSRGTVVIEATSRKRIEN